MNGCPKPLNCSLEDNRCSPIGCSGEAGGSLASPLEGGTHQHSDGKVYHHARVTHLAGEEARGD